MTAVSPLSLVPAEPLMPGDHQILVERTDEQLMVLASAGSQAAFGQLVERYMARVVNYCTKVTADPRSGEELAQETFLQLWAHRQRYAPSARFVIYLFTAARNRCKNHNRWWRRRTPWEDRAATATELDAAPVRASQLDDLLDRERQRRTREALTRLPSNLREAVILRFDQGLEYCEIAAIVERPEATVRSRVFHGLRRLRELLQTNEGDMR
ncbi:MAG: RNA polymerase sigma factor [Kofleriaceae bacterium]